MNNFRRNLLFLILPLTVGFISFYLTRNNMNLFDELNKPILTPPAWVFGVVWTFLYILMGISSVIILNSKSPYKKPAINLYLLSLIFNFVWSEVFFNRRQFGLSLLIIIIMLLLVYATIKIYYIIDKKAAYLQYPYFIWLIVALYLNAGILILN